MKYEVLLDEEDYLTYQLYAASRRPGTRKRMTRSRWIMLLAFLALAVYGHFQGLVNYSQYFAVFGLGLFILYPLYFKWIFKRHYTKWVREHYQDRFHEPVEMEFFDTYIYSKDQTGSGNVSMSAVASVDEIEHYFFIQLSSGNAFIIPKDKVTPKAGIEEEIQKVIDLPGVESHVDATWKW